MVAAFRHYLIHYWFRLFAQGITFAYGALLLYSITGSLLWVLLFTFFVALTGTTLKSLGLPLLFKVIKRYSIYGSMIAGLVLSALVYVVLYYLQTLSTLSLFFYSLLIIAGILQGTSNALYWTPSNAIQWYYGGRSNTPGRYHAYIVTAGSSAMLSAAAVGLLLHTYSNFVLLFLIGSFSLLVSIIPLGRITLPHVSTVSLRQCIRKITLSGFIANISPEATLSREAIPLIILLLFGSLHNSIWIIGVATIGAIIASHITGWFKDHNKAWLNILGFIGLIITWWWYAIAQQAIEFIVLGIALGIFTTIMSTGRDSRISREVSNSRAPIASTAAVEFARSLGSLIAMTILLIALALTQTIPQAILLFGILFTLTKGIYSIGAIAQRI